MSVAEELRSVEHEWAKALRDCDFESLDAILAEQFVSTTWTSSGRVTSKDEYLHAATATRVDHCEIEDLQVHTTESAAVVNGRMRCELRFGDHRWKSNLLITDVFEVRGGKWQAIARHSSLAFEDRFPSLTLTDRSPKLRAA